jgi:hypothetical protein
VKTILPPKLRKPSLPKLVKIPQKMNRTTVKQQLMDANKQIAQSNDAVLQMVEKCTTLHETPVIA